MLRASNAETGIDRPEHAHELEGFAAAVARGADDLTERRDDLRERLGDERFAEAAAVTAAFHGYVRVAEGTGIPVDELVVATSTELRSELGIDAYAGRANSDLGISARPAEDFTPRLDR
ncbi:MAG: hypothetical protein AAGA99_00955 [Actinomycetota bacterium]